MKFSHSSIFQLIQADTKLNNIYHFHKKLSNGCFGYLFLVTNKKTQRKSALKIQYVKNQLSITLKKQYQYLKKLEGTKGIPSVYNFGRTDRLIFIELELLQNDLGEIIKQKTKFDVNLIYKIGKSMLQILELVHHKKIIHRDIKPQNIMLNKNREFYLIDFGISYENNQDSEQNIKKKISFVGTPRYASISAHKGIQQSPSDDIESLMYNLIYLANKRLPWTNLNVQDDIKMDVILKTKLQTSKEQLCQGLPNCILDTFNYVKKLKRHQKINYKYLIQLFQLQNDQFEKKILKSSVKNNCKLKSIYLSNQKYNSKRTSIQSQFLVIPQISNLNYSSQNLVEYSNSLLSSSIISKESPKKILVAYKTDQIEQPQQTVESKIKQFYIKYNTAKFR